MEKSINIETSGVIKNENEAGSQDVECPWCICICLRLIMRRATLALFVKGFHVNALPMAGQKMTFKCFTFGLHCFGIIGFVTINMLFPALRRWISSNLSNRSYCCLGFHSKFTFSGIISLCFVGFTESFPVHPTKFNPTQVLHVFVVCCLYTCLHYVICTY